VHGKCRESAGFDVAIERPAALFGVLLAERLNAGGIAAEGELMERHVNLRKVKVLKEYSTPISQVLYRCNKDSFNLAAESLLKTISAQANRGANGSWQGGSVLVSQYLNSLGIGSDEFCIDDGSGLSKENKLSANAIVEVLLNTYESERWQIFKGSLAVGGQDGTIRKYFKDKKYKGKIFGKTGYIKGVKAFSGICETGNGEFVFSILTNNSYNGKTRGAINDIVKAIIDAN
jgi:serine-type D-Ala-D-Ala carboxypeptidase/endopeptidase (penicillin-binding protein 4)